MNDVTTVPKPFSSVCLAIAFVGLLCLSSPTLGRDAVPTPLAVAEMAIVAPDTVVAGHPFTVEVPIVNTVATPLHDLELVARTCAPLGREWEISEHRKAIDTIAANECYTVRLAFTPRERGSAGVKVILLRQERRNQGGRSTAASSQCGPAVRRTETVQGTAPLQIKIIPLKEYFLDQPGIVLIRVLNAGSKPIQKHDLVVSSVKGAIPSGASFQSPCPPGEGRFLPVRITPRRIGAIVIMVEGPQARATGEVQAKFDPNTPVESLLPVGAGYIGVLGELQKGDALQWPVPLQGPEYEKVCKKLSKLFAEAIQEIRAGTLNEIQENLKDLEESINKNIIAFSVSQYVQARRYLIRLNRGLQTLQQTNPHLSAPRLPQKLADVPEAALEDPSYAFLPGDEAIDHAGHLIDKINFVNSKKRDGFVEALARKRADLGLPFIMGDAGRLSAERGRHFFHELTELHLAMRFVFASNDPAALATSLPNPAARQGPVGLTDGVVAAMATSSPYPAAQSAVAIQARVAALIQVVTPEGAELGQQMVKCLTTISHVDATRALARLAVFSEEDEVHKDAVAALAARQRNDFTDILLSALKYPWPAVAERAADAIATLKRKDLLPQLVEVLERPDPRAPQTQQKDGKNVIVVRELVRINHLRNCLLCHPPASPAAIPPETAIRELRAVFQCGDRNTSARCGRR